MILPSTLSLVPIFLTVLIVGLLLLVFSVARMEASSVVFSTLLLSCSDAIGSISAL
jgi:hypothetical protein